MKKSTLLVIVSGLILLLGFFILSPLSGKIRVTDMETKTPKDPISKFINKFSANETGLPFDLQHINKIVINGNGERNFSFIDIVKGKKNLLAVKNGYYIEEDIPYTINNGTLTVNLGGNNYSTVELTINDSKHIQSIQLNNINAQLNYKIKDTLTRGIHEIIVDQNSAMTIKSNAKDSPLMISDLNLQAKSKSILKLENIRFQNLYAKVANARMDINDSVIADSIRINLQGLSNVIHPKMEQNNNIKELTVLGDTNYYIKHKR